MYCPRCGDVMDDSGPTLRCVRGNMPLSPHLDQRLRDGFTKGGQPPDEGARVNWGGHWFCPCCGVRMSHRDGRVSCPDCGRALSPYLYQLIEIHPHED